jgi:dTDP-4-amino-4,6-dideoxygalactose transaminase
MSAVTAARPAPLPITRLDAADPELLAELLAVVERVATSGAFTLGDEVEAFEAEFAAYCGSAHGIGVSSGTDAIRLALLALGVGPGDEVIVPANTFIATAEAVAHTGATPRPVDVDPRTHLLSLQAVADAIGSRTRAIVAVHLMGSTVDLGPLMALADATGVAVVEDAAQAHGAWCGDRRAGATGAAGCFSFYPTKNLGAWGDGGMVVTDDPEVARRVRLLRSHGEERRYEHLVVGGTSRLHAVQAALLRVKLRRLDGWNADRRRLGAALREALRGAAVTLPEPAAASADHVHHLFVVRTERRDELRRAMAACDVATAVHYPTPVHRTEAFAGLGLAAGSLPVAEGLAETSCTLPLFPSMTADDVDRVAAGIHQFSRES